MYTFMSHAPKSVMLYRSLEDNPPVKNGRKIDKLAILTAQNFFNMMDGYEKLSWEEIAALKEFGQMLSGFGLEAIEKIYDDGFEESFREMLKESDCGILYPKDAREKALAVTGWRDVLGGKARFKDLPKSFRMGDNCAKLRRIVLMDKYGSGLEEHPHKCPICGRYEFREYGGGNCPVCGWADCWIREKHPEDAGAYDKSLKEYRKAYREEAKKRAGKAG